MQVQVDDEQRGASPLVSASASSNVLQGRERERAPAVSTGESPTYRELRTD
jgi:hypothetical protein